MTQATLGAALRFEGVGLHTGEPGLVEVTAAPADSGIVFVLQSPRDRGTPVMVPAIADNVVDTSRATVIGRDGARVSTTEHLLSALFATGVTNARIAVDGPEIPIADGSARDFVDAIDAAGIVSQDRPRKVLSLDEPVVVRDGERMIAALPAPAFRVRFVAEFPPPIGAQYFCGEIEPACYRREIAGARTFGYLHEVEALRERGLVRGATLENALVFTADGPVQPLRWPDEVVRHKVLDLIGDLALLGAWPQFEVVAFKSGHDLHSVATRTLRAKLRVPSS
ncbi:MAG: UDP-3-O-acyl-N-acetylglucosamine deacetylase [Candidatus Tumulicola sp.]